MVQFIFSTALDGKIKAWLYDNLGSRVDYDAPGRWCTTMAYSADGTRSIFLITATSLVLFLAVWFNYIAFFITSVKSASGCLCIF